MIYQSKSKGYCYEFLKILFITIALSFPIKMSAQVIYQVKDINPGEPSSNISGFSTMKNKGFFWANDDNSTRQLWVTDGQTEGTFRISDLPITAWSNVPVSISDSLLIFVSATEFSGLELFYSDGSVGSGELLIDLYQGSNGSISQFGRGDGKYAYFIGKQQFSKGLYRTNGSEEGTIKLLDDVDGLSKMLAYNGTNYTRIFHSGETWLIKTDGSGENTEFITKIQSEQVSIPNVGIVAFNDSIYFLKEDTDHNWGLWRTDGTINGLMQVAQLNPDGNGSPNNLVATDEKLFFQANDGINSREIWISDGTSEGTTMLTDFNDPNNSPGSSFTTFKNSILFRRNDSISGNELWISNGTVDGTHLLKDIWPGISSSNLDLSNSIILDSIIFFTASDPENGHELWRSDGTEQGTFMVMDICPGDCNSSPQSLHKLDESRFLFKAFTLETGIELWIYDNQSSVSQNSVTKEINNSFKVFPNPTSKNDVQLTWSSDLNPSAFIILNTGGNKIFSSPINNLSNYVNVSTEDFSRGLYIICLLGDSKQVIAQTKLLVL